MKKLPRWAKMLGIIVVVLVVIALALPYVLDVDRYKPEILAAIEKETGRKASIGKIRARFIPTVGFTIENFVLGSPASFGDNPLLSVEVIRGSLAWGPLLSRQFQLSGIELVRPKVQLIEDENGKSNYDFPAKPAAKPAAPGALNFKIADIDGIEITGAQIVLAQVAGRARRLIPSIHASNLNAELSDVALDAKKLKQWRGEANLRGVMVELPGLAPLEFRSGEFTLAQGAVDANFKTSLGKAADVTGKIRVDDLDKTLAKFELSMPVLDLGQLASAGAQTSPAAAAGSAPARSEMIAQGRISADAVRYAPHEATQARVDVRIFTDRVEAWPVTMNVYEGTVNATARMDRRATPERFSANIEVRKFNVGKLMDAMKAKQKVTGTGELTLQVAGALGANLMNSLTGSGNFAVRNGKLPGLNIGGAMQSLARVQKFLTFGAGSAEQFAGETAFSAITGDVNLSGGRVRSDRIHLDSPSGAVDLRGSFGLDETLDYNGQAVLMGGQTGSAANNPIAAITGILGGVTKQTIGRVSVPFSVRGTFSKPQIGPGAGIPGISVGAPGGSSAQPSSAQTPPNPPQKKRSLLDLFRKPS